MRVGVLASGAGTNLQAILDRVSKLPQLRDTNTDLAYRGLTTALKYDRDTASRLGLSSQQIDETLFAKDYESL